MTHHKETKTQRRYETKRQRPQNTEQITTGKQKQQPTNNKQRLAKKANIKLRTTHITNTNYNDQGTKGK